MPKVSIIVPNYNHATFLEERLDSIFHQTLQDFEVILLDDSSIDNSIEILNKYASNSKISHFIINKKNSGSPFKQWKKGIDLARGDYLWIAESDDTCDLNFLEEQVKALECNDISVAKTLILIDNVKTKEELHNHFYLTYDTSSLEAEHFIDYCPIGNVSSVVFKREILNKEGLNFSSFDVIGDMMFYFENFLKKKIAYTPTTNSYFRRKKDGLSNLSKKDINYYKKYFNEHTILLKKISKIVSVDFNNQIKKRLRQRFNKVKNRLSFEQKISFTYLYIHLNYLKSNKEI